MPTLDFNSADIQVAANTKSRPSTDGALNTLSYGHMGRHGWRKAGLGGS